MFIEYWFIKEYINNFFIGKTLGIIGMSLFIVIIFCSYAFITGESSLFIDIGSFIVGSIICQLISINIMKIKFSKKVERLGVYTFIFIGIIFTFFTFFLLIGILEIQVGEIWNTTINLLKSYRID